MRKLPIGQTHRQCTSCQKMLPLDNFDRRRDISNGHFAQCKVCRSTINKLWYAENRERKLAKGKQWYKANREKKLASNRRWIEENLEKRKTEQKEYRASAEVKARLRAASKEWDTLHPERRNERAQKYRQRIKDTIAYRLTNSIRKLIYNSLKGRKNGHHWEELVGYTAEDLRAHLESQWEPWMNWDNWGIYNPNKRTWQIDHIKPISSFNITDAQCDDFKKCWALENLRPIPALENLLKKDKVVT